jgi:endonuclease/exonuclease/phosphatase family metal-dependent hydrolase
VARAVVTFAPCTVQIVRDAAEDRAHTVHSARRVLLATDGSETSNQAARAVAARPWPEGSEFRVITVEEPWAIRSSRVDHADPQHNQVRWIAGELGFHYRIGAKSSFAWRGLWKRCAHTVADRSQSQPRHHLRKSEPRGCLDVLLELGGREALHRLRIFNVHLGTGYFERRHQSKKLFDIMKDCSHDSAPRLVLGDFNEWPRGLASHLLETHFNTAEPRRRFGRARSYPGILPLAHVDHIYYDSPLEVVNVWIHRTRLALIASDHLPVVAEIRYEPA